MSCILRQISACHGHSNMQRVITVGLQLVVLLQLNVLGDETKNDRPHFASTPATNSEWRLLESHVQKTIQKTLPAIVAIGVSSRIKDWSATFPHFEHFASGVIIRDDGLILSQWHVTHELGRESRKPGELADVILQDGRRLKAELLGGNQLRDVSLLRLVQPGDYPHLELAENNSVSLGDWVLKLGHPMGYRASRGAVSRLGRVLFLGETIDIVADCQSAGGDSGGPLVDLDGKVVGLIGSTPQGVHFYPSTPHFVSPWCYTNVTTIRELMQPMLNSGREIMPQPSGSVSDERTFLTRNPVLSKDFNLSDKNVGDPRIVLPLDEWRQGKKTLSDWNGLTKTVANCVVEVLIEGHRVSLGTVVSPDGWVLTKASEIPEALQCRLANGEIVSARVISIDAAFDLAMLKLDVTGLHAVEWSRDRNRPNGTIIAALSGKGAPMAMGIISVSQRSLEGPFPATLVKAPRRGPPLPLVPEVSGQQVASKGFVVSFVQGSAAEAGIHVGDILLSIDNRPIRQNNDLASSIKGHSPGDKLHVAIERAGQYAELTLTLMSEPYSRCQDNDRMNESFRRDSFPVAFEHDIPLWLDECGGPLVDLDGKVIGMTIARVGQHGCMAIPADVIESLIPALKSKTNDSAK